MSRQTLAAFTDELSELMRTLSREILRLQTQGFYKTKITMPQLIVLEDLSRTGPLKMSDLAHRMHVTTAAATGMIDRLVRDGYVARVNDPKDRRITWIKLTGKGEKSTHHIVAQRKHITAQMFGMISNNEREEYLRILRHILEHLTQKDAARPS